MLAKLTSKNQLTLPKSAVQAVGASGYFDVEVRAGQIVLTPVRIQRGDAVRAKLAALGLEDADVVDAVQWARRTRSATAAKSSPRAAEPDVACATGGPRAAKPAPRRKPARRA